MEPASTESAIISDQIPIITSILYTPMKNIANNGEKYSRFRAMKTKSQIRNRNKLTIGAMYEAVLIFI